MHLLRLPYVREEGNRQVIEYGGEALSGLSTDERATLTNMWRRSAASVELSCLTKTRRFVRERRGTDLQLEPWMCSDDGAEFVHVMEVECNRLEPMLARPGDPVTALPYRNWPRRGDRYRLCGSCTGGKREDLLHYHAVLNATQSMRSSRHTLLSPVRSQDVRDYCVQSGMLDVFERVALTDRAVAARV